MKDEQTAYAICRQLDQVTAGLDDDISNRLRTARTSALSEYRSTQPSSTPARHRSAGRADMLSEQPSRWLRLAIAGVPAMMLVIGLVGFGQWSEQRRIEQLAELDAEVLLDDLPIAAYADKGFGVYLKNTREWPAITAYHVAASQAR